MEEVIFIDQEGNIIQYDTICSHVGLAIKLINENEELKKEFIDSGYRVPNLFLIIDKGYIAVSIDPIYGMNLTANTSKLTDIQRKILDNYLISGAKFSLVDEETEKAILKGRHDKQKKLTLN